MPRRSRVFAALGLIALGGLGNVIAQTEFLTPSSNRHMRAPRSHPQPPPVVVPKDRPDFGDPLAGLTADELADFAEGLEDFQEVDDAASGLGPVFNNVSCVACHSTPVAGGASDIVETRFGHLDRNGKFDPLAALGGSLMQDFAIDPAAQESVPAQANIVAKRLTTPLFGAGLIEAIPDATIMRNADAQRSSAISGRVSVVQDVATGETRVGRFGWKAQQATLLAFAGDAYLNEIGITSRLFPQENAPRGDVALLAQFDLVADPEDTVDPATGKADIDHFADYMRTLAPPPTVPPTQSSRNGRDLFAQIGCDGCHIPAMTTGASPIRALDHKTVPLYSDLLLHDMGSLGDGIAQGTARPAEMRTPPLWGLRARGPFLHDGRATTVDAAIRMHDGEADHARDRYARLNGGQQRQLLDFLNSI
jgi:CxxC motif-containing protein (DUF1111 family)